jgi:hypothetical protein
MGLAIIGGAVLVVDLRLLGFGLQHQPAAAIAEDAERWLLRGLAVMVSTGILLFMCFATKYYYLTFFWVKMAALVAVIIFTWSIHRRVAMAQDADTRPLRAGSWRSYRCCYGRSWPSADATSAFPEWVPRCYFWRTAHVPLRIRDPVPRLHRCRLRSGARTSRPQRTAARLRQHAAADARDLVSAVERDLHGAARGPGIVQAGGARVHVFRSVHQFVRWWLAVENSGMAMAETSNLLLVPRPCSNGKPAPIQNADWQMWVQELREASLSVYKAGQAKNDEVVLEPRTSSPRPACTATQSTATFPAATSTAASNVTNHGGDGLRGS